MKIGPGDALIIVDAQNDFCPGGALAVPEGDAVVEPINRVAPLFAHVVTTQDWHPADHCSFLSRGGGWPSHCVANTTGAALRADLVPGPTAHSIRKATQSDADAYSGFDGTGLAAVLRQHAIERVFVAGLATDYCVRATVLGAVKEGFQAYVLEDAIRAVDITPGDGRNALQAMKDAGAHIIRTADLE